MTGGIVEFSGIAEAIRMAEKQPEKDTPLIGMARTIGSALGQAKVEAGRVVEGVKAAAKAGADAYAGKKSAPKKKPARRARKGSGKR
jgi:hypothetical protein